MYMKTFGGVVELLDNVKKIKVAIGDNIVEIEPVGITGTNDGCARPQTGDYLIGGRYCVWCNTPYPISESKGYCSQCGGPKP